MASQNNYSLDKGTANDLLNNVLDSCNIPPSSGSVHEIMNKRTIEKTPLTISKILAVVFLILAVMAPLGFKKDPDFAIVSSSKTVAVTSHSLYDDCFIMTLSGAADYNNIYAKKNDGAYIFPDSVEGEAGVVIFPYNGEALNIYIPTASGDCIQAVLNERVTN